MVLLNVTVRLVRPSSIDNSDNIPPYNQSLLVYLTPFISFVLYRSDLLLPSVGRFVATVFFRMFVSVCISSVLSASLLYVHLEHLLCSTIKITDNKD